DAQNVDFSDSSPAYKILREGRKFGCSAWFATQSFSGFHRDEMSALDNAATKIYFNPTESVVGLISTRLGLEYQEVLRYLKKEGFLVSIQFINVNQILKRETHTVNVPAMSERKISNNKTSIS